MQVLVDPILITITIFCWCYTVFYWDPTALEIKKSKGSITVITTRLHGNTGVCIKFPGNRCDSYEDILLKTTKVKGDATEVRETLKGFAFYLLWP